MSNHDEYRSMIFRIPRPIRSKFERDITEGERQFLLRQMRALDRECAADRSEYVKELLEQMQMQHDQLEAQIEAYDRRKTIPAGICGDQSMLESLVELPRKLVQARRERGYSLDELARRAGVCKRTLLTYEQTNFRKAPFETLCALARALTGLE